MSHHLFPVCLEVLRLLEQGVRETWDLRGAHDPTTASVSCPLRDFSMHRLSRALVRKYNQMVVGIILDHTSVCGDISKTAHKDLCLLYTSVVPLAACRPIEYNSDEGV